MKKLSPLLFAALLAFACLAKINLAQSAASTGDLQIVARISPTAAKPEPVRDFTLYVLTMSFEDIKKQIGEEDKPPTREKFIEDLKVSQPLKDWLKAHDVMDLMLPGVDKLITPEDVLKVPEFLEAYQRSNSGGVTNGIPKPKYKDADKTENPARYEKEHGEYFTALKKFMQSHPDTLLGMELELDSVNPARKWAEVQSTYRKKVARKAPAEAQTKFLVAKADTDLEGHATIARIPAGNYWLSSLDLDAGAGDIRLKWDVPVTIEAGKTTQLNLTNLNAVEPASTKTP